MQKLNNLHESTPVLLNIHKEESFDKLTNLIKMLVDNQIVEKRETINLVISSEIQIFIEELIKNGKLTYEKQYEYFIESGVILLGEYLVHKGIISDIDNLVATIIQKKDTEKPYGEILMEKHIIRDSNYILFLEALDKLGKIHLGEYLILIGELTIKQFEFYSKIQKHQNIHLGKILFDLGIVNINILKKAFQHLGIQVDEKDFQKKEDTKKISNDTLTDPWKNIRE